MKIWHVDTSDGRTYGVAASNGTEAKLFVQARITSDESDAHPLSARYVDTVAASRGPWSYGTVLAY